MIAGPYSVMARLAQCGLYRHKESLASGSERESPDKGFHSIADPDSRDAADDDGNNDGGHDVENDVCLIIQSGRPTYNETNPIILENPDSKPPIPTILKSILFYIPAVFSPYSMGMEDLTDKQQVTVKTTRFHPPP
ncbi:hypothetical protein PoB_001932600 [Plakobranchus ocellatus]|uniref:Uncharacterized protein n=1 Tax=Plakobranchus ocellatus TaxID=259542 RepID=A0AAV3ZA57_9GAST|nr:hypothetical protein PoB_001932600 [Plakobranchus ocellatus]